ncbi:WXG100 family type VII secretion target [Mycolicibacterium cosmeticum]|uniref:WXG100 family type VII secretion target n=1 Tax=Mycolicibacterium cosmeticum TaxID=258533 RepID=UPI003204AC8A
MSGRLEVDPAAVFATAQTLSNHAEDLREELRGLSREWDDLSHSWSGVAASAYLPPWEEWHEAAAKLTDSLSETAARLAEAGSVYDEQDSDSAQALANRMLQ